MNHDRRTLRYSQKLARKDKAIARECPFCKLSDDEEIVEETPTMLLLYNRVHYDSFEGIPVKDHLMLIPRQHRIALNEFTSREQSDYMAFLSKYESQGYSFYGRGLNNGERSQPHLHTHLLQLRGKRAKFLVYIMRPYFVWRGRQHQS